MSQVFKALSDPTRRRVLQLQRSGPMVAGELLTSSKSPSRRCRAYFAVLKEADLVHAEKVGTRHLSPEALGARRALLLAHSFGITAQTPVPKKETAR